ncbi:MAG: hypothetical protein K2W95_10805 [Candidatus Obscuribacterales bacterium]|nr:hypothetical protein [Candidatus Obscuribacterales bacterium]
MTIAVNGAYVANHGVDNTVADAGANVPGHSGDCCGRRTTTATTTDRTGWDCRQTTCLTRRSSAVAEAVSIAITVPESVAVAITESVAGIANGPVSISRVCERYRICQHCQRTRQCETGRD